jgi:signal peptidase I
MERPVVSSRKSQKSVVREYTEAIIIAVILALFIRSFIVQAFKIPSGSMLPTLQIGDHLLVNKFIYGVKNPMTGAILIPWKSPKRGDVVVFKYPKDESIDYIKRVIGVAGDTIELRNGEVFIDNIAIEDVPACYAIQFANDDKYTKSCNRDPVDVHSAKSEAAISPNSDKLMDFGPFKVPSGHLFVMGDNRFHSSDSRFWGYVDERLVLGKAFVLYWSWDANEPFFSAGRWKSITERWTRIGDIVR